MGLFDSFKKKSTVDETENKYYQPDSYYTSKTYEGTQFEQEVITFEQRKKTAIPSERGLYPAEILLLDYCSKGIYPDPKNGYPGLWWFKYGIRDVGAALSKLEMEGYIEYGSPKNSVKAFTVNQLKELLGTNGQSTSGKKDELVCRVVETISDEILLATGVQRKFQLTELGQLELKDNEYVPYMHSVHNKTTEDATFGMTYNVWSINQLFGRGDKSNWKAIVEEQEQKRNKEASERHDATMESLKKIDPQIYNKIKSGDEQIAAVQEARTKYARDNDIDAYIAFWEKTWHSGGIEIGGSTWHFELPDLYIKIKRYDDALACLQKLKKEKTIYSDKADSYIERVNKLKAKG